MFSKVSAGPTRIWQPRNNGRPLFGLASSPMRVRIGASKTWEFRGQGAVDALLRETVHEARAKGFKLAQVSTYIGNDQAIAVYERAGFRFSDEKRCETLEAALGTPGFVRFLLPLSL
jgi:GNAT superfamily N-acetyltransferase